MPSRHIPEGFTAVTPYLTVNGAATVIEFAKAVFDAEEVGVYHGAEGRIQHAAIRIQDAMIELSDGNENWPPIPCALHVYVPDTDAVYAKAIQAGATSLFEPADMFYGERGAGVRDAAGNHWYIATFQEKLSDEEIERRRAAMQQ